MNNTYNILPTAESDRVEFKTTFNDEVIISLVAFSNTRGGAVYVGVLDNGDVKGSGIQNCSRRSLGSKVSDELIHYGAIQTGHFDNVSTAKYTLPTIWDIGKVYKRLIIDIAENRNCRCYIDIMIEVFNSLISRKIEDFNSSMYYENPEYIFQSFARIYTFGKI